MSGGRDWRDLQDSDEQRIPELLGPDQVVTVAVEFSSLGVVAIRKADEDPDENERWTRERSTLSCTVLAIEQ